MTRSRTPLLLMTLLLPMGPTLASEKHCTEEAAECAQKMAEHFRHRGWVGINMEYDEDKGTVSITKVIAGSPAEKAGLQNGDQLVALNGIAYSMDNEESLKREHQAFHPGGTAVFTVSRAGRSLDIEVELEEIPESVLAQWIGAHLLESHLSAGDGELQEEAEATP